MPDQQIDKGNPNVFTTYRGRYEFTMAEGATCNSPYAMLTTVNTVQFTENVELASTFTVPGVFCTLPEELRPQGAVELAAIVQLSDNTMHMARVELAATGTMTITRDFIVANENPITVIYLDSISYDLASNHYSAVSSSQASGA